MLLGKRRHWKKKYYEPWVFHHRMKHQKESWKYEVQRSIWRILRCFIWWWNTVSSAWCYFSNKMILERELRMQKWAVFHLISKHSLNINLLACFAGYTCRSSWQQTLLKVQSQCQTSNMVSAHCTPQRYSPATVWTGPSIFIGTNIFVKKRIVFAKSSL